MASFLAIQLLGVAMKEITREDGESKMSLEDVQKLAEALSGPVTETKQAQDKLETTWDAAGDAVEDLLGEEGMTKLDPPAATKQNASETAVEEQTKKEETPTAEVKPTTPKDTASVQDKPEVTVTESKPPKAKATTKSLKSPEGVRIPEVISAEFGKALEVETSNVNPLRNPPKHDPNKNSKAEAPAAAEKSDPASSTPIAEAKQSTSNAPAPIDSVSKQTQEIFQRQLLAARFQFESQSKPIQEEKTSSKIAAEAQAKSAPVSSPESSSATDETKAEDVVEPPTIKKSPAPPPESSSQGESVEMIRDFLSQPPSKPSPISVSKISESRLKSIVEARRQPKNFNEEASVADKYSNMSLEERAFSILFDLGMVEANKDPRDPSYDHSDDDEFCEHLNL